MNKRQGPEEERPEEVTRDDACVCAVADPIEHYGTGVIGFVATLLIVGLTYPWLRAVAELSPILSSTWLVFSFAAVWLVCWTSLELAWEYHAGRVDQS